MKTYRRPPVGVEKLFCSVVDSKRMQGGLFQIINHQYTETNSYRSSK